MNLSAKLKFGIQALLTVILISSGFRFKEIYIPFIQYTLPLGLFSYPLTFIWIVGVSNAINLIDGMDGLAGGLSCFGLVSVGLYSLVLNDIGLSILAFTLAGSLLAFLIFNFPPAKIFMGDAGSYVVGLTLAVVPLANNPQYDSVTLYLAVTVCIIPIFDTFSSMIRRMVFYRVSFFTPDKEHTHHKMLNLGLSTLQVLTIVYLICACLCGVTLLWSLYQTDWSLMLIVCVWGAVGIFFLALSYDFKKYFKNDPEAFTETMMAFRKGGLTKKEQAAIPEEQLINIRNAQNTIQVAEQMSEFFAEIRQLTNPNSSLYKQSGLQLSQEYEAYLNSLEIDLRLVTKFMENASVEKPKAVTKPKLGKLMGKLGKQRGSVEAKKPDMKERLATRGDRLEEYIEGWMERIFMPGHGETLGIQHDEMKEMYDIAKKIAANHGIGEPILVEGKISGAKRIKDLYNADVSMLPDKQTDVIRNELAELLEKKHGIKLENAEEALPTFAINAALARVKDAANKEPENAQVRSIHVLNENVDTVADSPIVEAVLTDASVAEAPEPKDLAPHDTFMGALAIPALSDANIKALWNHSLSAMDALDPDDETVKIAENRSETGIGLTTLLTNDKGEAVVTHVLTDAPNKRTVIISEDVDKKVQDMFARNGITYIDRKAPDAAAKIDKEIEFMTLSRPNSQEVMEYMQGALMLRDTSAGETLGEALAASSAETVHNPIFVSHVERPPVIAKDLLTPTRKAEKAAESSANHADAVSFAKPREVMSYAATMRAKKTR